MKRLLPILLLVLSFHFGFAQHPKWEKIKALKTAHITEELELTSKEAEKFWPIYNAAQKKMHQQRMQLKGMKKDLTSDFDNVSEAKAKEMLNQFLDVMDQMHNDRKNLTLDLLAVIPAKKVIKLKKAEDDFNRKLLKEFRGRRGHGGPKSEKH